MFSQAAANIARAYQDQRAQAPGGQQQAKSATENGEDEVFCEKLTSEARSACANGNANGDLACPRGAAYEQQARYVGARNEQYQAYRAHQDEKRRVEFAAGYSLRQIGNISAMIVFGPRIAQRESLHDGVQIGLRLRSRRPTLEQR